MDATQYLTMVRRWWWLLIVGTVMAVGAYGVAVRIRDQRQGTPAPTYSASATFFVSDRPASATSGAPAGDAAAQTTSLDRLTQSYAAIIQGRGVAERIVSSLALGTSPEDVQSRITVETPALTQLIKVTAKGGTPEDAQQLVDGVTHAFIALRQDGNLPGAVSVVEVNRGQLSAVPGDSLRNQLQTVVLVAVFGMLGAAAIVVAFEYVTDAVRDRADAERSSGLPALASIPIWNAGRDAKRALAMVDGGTSAVAERFRMLRTAIGLATEDQPAQVILVAGGTRGAGTTTVAANVAAALAQAGRRVAVVDADMREPSMHRVFGVAAGPGLSDVIASDSATVDSVVRATAADGVMLVPAGAAVANASELLSSPRFDAMIRTLRERFDAIVIDSPPALLLTDATLLAAKCDATIIVARGDVTRRSEIAGAVEMLRPAAKRMLGVVLNGDANVPGGGFAGFRIGEERSSRAEVRA